MWSVNCTECEMWSGHANFRVETVECRGLSRECRM